MLHLSCLLQKCCCLLLVVFLPLKNELGEREKKLKLLLTAWFSPESFTETFESGAITVRAAFAGSAVENPAAGRETLSRPLLGKIGFNTLGDRTDCLSAVEVPSLSSERVGS